jgi:hypothetical protein
MANFTEGIAASKELRELNTQVPSIPKRKGCKWNSNPTSSPGT